jgi:agmatine deiminase
VFGFNGWGGKYVLAHDDRVAARVAEAAGRPAVHHDWILEGGSIDVDGQGTCLTTRECLLNPNRNPRLNRLAIERKLAEALGTRTVLWLEKGLLNDHTDGHVDTLARFVAPGVVVCMEPADPDDPNREVLQAIAADLERFTDAAGRRLDVRRIPSPGRVLGRSGEVLPASYVNFYIANHSVAVPTYDSPHDAAALAMIAELFPNRRTVGIAAKALLAGGGALHCITQQQPTGSIRSPAE